FFDALAGTPVHAPFSLLCPIFLGIPLPQPALGRHPIGLGVASCSKALPTSLESTASTSTSQRPTPTRRCCLIVFIVFPNVPA
ncbi:unnamed protein product, partial [Ilex paraguariensis]